MKPHSYPALCFVLLTLIAATAVAAEKEKKPDPLAIRTSASFAPAQSDVIVRMRVEPDARSRELTVEWIADDLSGGSHAITLEGARAATTHQYAIRRMAPGSYTVTAILRLSDGSEIRRAATVTVVGVGGLDAVRRNAPAGASR